MGRVADPVTLISYLRTVLNQVISVLKSLMDQEFFRPQCDAIVERIWPLSGSGIPESGFRFNLSRVEANLAAFCTRLLQLSRYRSASKPYPLRPQMANRINRKDA